MALAPATCAPQPLAGLLAGLETSAVPDIEVSGVTLDSRRVKPGDLFLAFGGLNRHGLDHVDQAIASGAAAVAWDAEATPGLNVPAVRVGDLAAHAGLIASRAWDEPTRSLFVTGITGTDGKTSCAHMLAQALDSAGERCGYMGTLGYGFVGDAQDATHTTPDAATLHGLLAGLQANGARAVALEVSSHALDQQRAQAVDFDVAVLTNVGRDHLDYHGDVASYAAAKRRLFDMPGLDCTVLNADDDYGRRWLDNLPDGVKPVAYGLSPQVAELAPDYVSVREVITRPQGLKFVADTRWGEVAVESSLIGRFNTANLAAVLSVLLVHDVEPSQAVRALSQVQTVPGRMQQVSENADQPLVVVDYAHTPNALEHALQAVSDHAAGRVHCVFGCGGDRDTGKRPLMAAAAARHADTLWLTDDNPRSESPQAITDAMLAGIDTQACETTVEHDRGRAIARAIQVAGPGDAVLIAGKGHETTQQVGERTLAHDDRVAARQVLEAA